METMAKVYAVKRGRAPGIYSTWAECQKQVQGFRNARFKSFATQAEAKQWLSETTTAPKAKTPSTKDATAYRWRLWTDGGSRNHGNHLGGHVRSNDLAAWAFYLTDGTEKIKQAQAVRGATNNCMEITGLLQALLLLRQRYLHTEPILATLDSRYVLDAITKGWLRGWQRNGWQTKGGKPVANKELWQQVAALLPQFTALDFQWTKGHATNEGNNLVDELLNEAMDNLAKQVNAWRL